MNSLTLADVQKTQSCKKLDFKSILTKLRTKICQLIAQNEQDIRSTLKWYFAKNKYYRHKKLKMYGGMS